MAIGRCQAEDKIDNKDVKDKETTSTSDNLLAIGRCQAQGQGRQELSSAISENLKQKLKKKFLTSRFSVQDFLSVRLDDTGRII